MISGAFAKWFYATSHASACGSLTSRACAPSNTAIGSSGWCREAWDIVHRERRRQKLELREYWSIVRRHWWLPLAMTLAAALVSSVVALRGAAAFKTDMRIAISTIPVPDPNAALYYDPTYYSNLDSEYLADDMSEFMTSRAFASEVQRELSTANGVDVELSTIVNATRTKKTHRFI